jgi:hypothetical protein
MSSSTYVEISGTEATKCGTCLYPFNFCVPLNYVSLLFSVFLSLHSYFSGLSLFLLICLNFGFVPSKKKKKERCGILFVQTSAPCVRSSAYLSSLCRSILLE